MRIGIVTQPLRANYGGILQNFALQKVLTSLGHYVLTIDYDSSGIPIVRFVLSQIKAFIFLLLGGKHKPIRYVDAQRPRRKKIIDDFVKKHIRLSCATEHYSARYVSKYKLDCIVAGSDQIWRPIFNLYLEDMYLRFVDQKKVRKIAYAASFGTSEWEYTAEQAESCRRYAKKLDAVSVREHSGVKLCKEYWGIEAVHVLDPTLLLKQSDYAGLCDNIPKDTSPFFAAYILESVEEKTPHLEQIAQTKELDLRLFGADARLTLSIEEWISMFRDAQCVVTDSFHGMVFSIIFRKPFVTLGNEGRGNDRFLSLLEQLDLKSRLVSDISLVGDVIDTPIDWEKVYVNLDVYRRRSLDFLKTNLS